MKSEDAEACRRNLWIGFQVCAWITEIQVASAAMEGCKSSLLQNYWGWFPSQVCVDSFWYQVGLVSKQTSEASTKNTTCLFVFCLTAHQHYWKQGCMYYIEVCRYIVDSRHSCWSHCSNGNSPASTCRLETGEILNLFVCCLTAHQHYLGH